MAATAQTGGGASFPSFVPPEYQGDLISASQASGVPIDVESYQINLESGFNPKAVSPAGAQGIAQFMPGTWATWGKGSPFDPHAALTAYGKYMGSLVQQEGGSVFKALEAYNAGPGNLQAGASYATAILSQAGESQNISATPGTAQANPSATTTGFSLNPLQPLIDAFGGDIKKIMVRFGIILLGAALIVLGIVMMNEKRLKAVVRTGTKAGIAAL